MLVPFSKRSICWIEDLDFFAIIKESSFDLSLAYVEFHRCREVDWDQGGLLDPFYLYRWWTGKFVDFCKKRVHELKRESKLSSFVITGAYQLFQSRFVRVSFC